jgi:hypothetical protein
MRKKRARAGETLGSLSWPKTSARIARQASVCDQTLLSMDNIQAAHGRLNMAVVGSPQQWEFAGMAGRRSNFGGLWR